MSHTPGPWTIREGATAITVVGSNNETLFHEDKRITSVREDACLISAAPEMLDALVDLLEWQTLAPHDVVAQAHAAIAKARGEK